MDLSIYPFYLSIYRALAEFVEILSLGVCIVFGGGVWCSLGNFLAECYYLAEGYFLAEGYSWGCCVFGGPLPGPGIYIYGTTLLGGVTVRKP